MKNKNKKFLFFFKSKNKDSKEVFNVFVSSMLIVTITSSFFSFLDKNITENLNKNLKNTQENSTSSNLPTTEELINKIFAISDVSAANINYKVGGTLVDSKVSLNVAKNDTVTYIVKYKNTGNYVLRRDGNNQVVLRVKGGKTGLLKTDKWISSSVVANMTQSIVNVGQVAEFKVTLKNTSDTSIKEKYSLYIKSYGEEISGSDVEVTLVNKVIETSKVQASDTPAETKKDLNLESISYISSDKDFDIIDNVTNNSLVSVKAQEKVNISFNQITRTYTISKNGLIYANSKNKVSLKNTNSGTFDFGGSKNTSSLIALKSDFDNQFIGKASSGNGKVVCASASVDCTLVDNNTNVNVVNSETSNIANSGTVFSTTQYGYKISTLSHQYIKDNFKIRVGLGYDFLPATITNTQSYNIVDGDNSLISQILPGEQVVINYDKATKIYSVVKNGVVIKETVSYLKLQNINNGIFTINNMIQSPYGVNYNMFKGDLELRYNSTYDKAWVINELFIEDYLKGIGEASNSSSYEYLKIMAVTARTYATYHYLNDSKNAAQYFNVFSTTSDQVYYGYRREMSQPNVVRSVDETRGMYITYNDKIIQAFYSANAGGKTRTLSETWGGSDLPYLQAVEDKYTKNDVRFGHGVGMSQVGAIRMIAYDNADFVKVLTYYYTGVQIKKLY